MQYTDIFGSILHVEIETEKSSITTVLYERVAFVLLQSDGMMSMKSLRTLLNLGGLIRISFFQATHSQCCFFHSFSQIRPRRIY